MNLNRSVHLCLAVTFTFKEVFCTVFCTFFAFIKKTGKRSPGHTGLNYSPIAKYVKIGKKECSMIKEKGSL